MRAFGSLGKNGIVLIETKIPDNAERVPRSEHTFMATGLERDLLKLPEKGMSTRGENTPDLRTNLYWNPNVTIDSSGQTRLNIQTSDVTVLSRSVSKDLQRVARLFMPRKNSASSLSSAR